MKLLKLTLVIALFFTLVPMLQRGNVHAQQIEVIGITDSATVTSKWLGDKTGRFLVTGLTNMYLQRQSDSHKDWADEIGSTGFYAFDSVYLYPGIYELYINSILKPEYGAVKYQTSDVQNDTSYVHTTGTNEYSWVTNMHHQGQVQFYNYMPAAVGITPTISSHLTTKQYVDDKVSASDTSYLHTTGTDIAYGSYVYTGTVGITGNLTTSTGTVTFSTQAPTCTPFPATANQLTNKGYVDSSITAVISLSDTGYVHTTGSNAIYATCSFYGVTDFGAATTFYNVAPSSDVAATLPTHLVRKGEMDILDTGNVHTTGTDNLYGTYINYGSVAFVGVQPPACNTNPVTQNSLTRRGYVDSLVQNINDTNYVHTTGTDDLYGTYINYGSVAFVGVQPPACNTNPVTQNSLTRRGYVDSSVASITVAPYQEASNHVKIITNGTAQYGKVYTALAPAIDYFASPSGVNPCWVELTGVGLTIALSHNDLVNYVNVYSDNKSLGVVLGGTGATPTNNVTFKGVTIYMGAYDITTARTYNSFTFEDCTIYSYKDLTLTNCTLKNTVIYQPTGYSVTYDGSTTIDDCKFTQYASAGGSWSGWNTTFTDGFKTNYTMPSDPTAP